jgi:superfamily II DNA or RNA helicase
MKAVISNKIYMQKPADGYNSITEELTYKIKHKATGKGRPQRIEVIKNYNFLPKGLISFPSGRTDLIPPDWEIIDKRTINPVPFPNPKHALREDQLTVYDAVNDSCIINAKVGWGKTFTALWLARKLGQKTLVVTHTVNLRDQWITEAKTLFGMNIGVIGSGKFDIEDHAIVVGNIQSLSKYKNEIQKEFGTLIVDECHHVTATTFTEIVEMSYARYKIGLSGTLSRRDGKQILFQDYFGKDIHIPEVSNTVEPVIKLVHTGIALPHGLPWASKINSLLYDPDYQQYIAGLALAYMELGYSVLIPTTRVEFNNRIKDILGEKCVCITGATEQEDRNTRIEMLRKGEATALSASRSIISEGISINILGVLILAEPQSAEGGLLEQLIGRIQRLDPNKHLQPIVVDLQFAGPSDRAQNRARQAFYYSKDWEVLGT